MTTHYKEHMVDWLRDAHAMEEQTETILKGQIERLEHYPDLRLRLQEYLALNQNHQNLLKVDLNRLGSDTSTIKDLTGKLMAFGQNLTGIIMSDEVVKSAITLYVFTQVAVSSYSVLIATAEAAQDQETQRVCESILREKKTMANWLGDCLPTITRDFLSRSLLSSDTAKR